MGEYVGAARPSDAWRAIGLRDRYRARHEGNRAAVAYSHRDGQPGAWADRASVRFCQGTRLSRWREPGPLAWPSRSSVASQEQGEARETPRGDALCRDRRPHGRVAQGWEPDREGD